MRSVVLFIVSNQELAISYTPIHPFLDINRVETLIISKGKSLLDLFMVSLFREFI